MSIYRGWRAFPEDIHTETRRRTGRPTTPEESEPPPVHLRRAQPMTVLLPRTAEWLAQIPPQFRPTALASQFPRIANLLCASWNDPPAREKYLVDLLSGGGRSSRKGFPPTVLRELQVLHSVHRALVAPA